LYCCKKSIAVRSLTKDATTTTTTAQGLLQIFRFETKIQATLLACDHHRITQSLLPPLPPRAREGVHKRSCGSVCVLSPPGRLDRPSLPHHEGEAPREVQQQVSGPLADSWSASSTNCWSQSSTNQDALSRCHVTFYWCLLVLCYNGIRLTLNTFKII